jgi:hypothetical protein
MAKFYCCCFVLLSFLQVQAQIQTTGLVQLDGFMSFQLDKDLSNSVVTLTLSGPADRWFALGFNAELMLANTDCAVMTSEIALTDSYLPGGHNAPLADVENDWTIQSIALNDLTGIRTVIATRNFLTGHLTDFDFTTTFDPFHIIFAYSSTPGYVLFHHGADNYGGANVTFSALNTPQHLHDSFTSYPNPAKNQFFIETNNLNEPLSIQIANELGQVIFTQYLTHHTSPISIDSEKFSNGLYFITVATNTSKSSNSLVILH